jgi:hypothetical protein
MESPHQALACLLAAVKSTLEKRNVLAEMGVPATLVDHVADAVRGARERGWYLLPCAKGDSVPPWTPLGCLLS